MLPIPSRMLRCFSCLFSFSDFSLESVSAPFLESLSVKTSKMSSRRNFASLTVPDLPTSEDLAFAFSVRYMTSASERAITIPILFIISFMTLTPDGLWGIFPDFALAEKIFDLVLRHAQGQNLIQRLFVSFRCPAVFGIFFRLAG